MFGMQRLLSMESKEPSTVMWPYMDYESPGEEANVAQV